MTLFAQVQSARERLGGHAHVTPVMTSRTLDARVGAEVFLKCENLQRIGAFKFRGAFNAMSQLPEDARRRGVITHSSGNHAQAVALVGRILGIATTVVMPEEAAAIKRRATEEYGATVVSCRAAERLAVAQALQAAHGYEMIPPFDDERVIAGQGTATLELLSQTGGLDYLLAPCGGGGLLSGTAVAAKGSGSRLRVLGVEPAGADDATRSFRTGTLQRATEVNTVADALRTPSLGTVTFPLVLQYVDDMATVTEDAILNAMRFLFHRLKLVVEPAGAVAVAALLSGAVRPSGRVGVIVSGGNVDPEVAAEVFRTEDGSG